MKTHFTPSLLATAALLATCLPAFSAMAGVTVMSTPELEKPSLVTDPVTIPVTGTVTTTPVANTDDVTGVSLDKPTDAMEAKSSSKDSNDGEGAEGAEVIDRWLVSLPAGGVNLCMAGLCLGDSLDSLPVISTARSGAKVAGRWHLGFPVATANSYVERLSRDDSTLAVVHRMRETVQACGVTSLTGAMKPRMRIIFVPDDATDGGVEVIAEALPKVMRDDESTYAVTQIKMMVSGTPADLANEWPERVGAMWPGLVPSLMRATGPDTSNPGRVMPEHYGPWEAKESYGTKTSFSRTNTSISTYKVEPALATISESFNSNEFNRKQWDGRTVTHTLTWSHGITKLDLALSKQGGCGAQKAQAQP